EPRELPLDQPLVGQPARHGRAGRGRPGQERHPGIARTAAPPARQTRRQGKGQAVKPTLLLVVLTIIPLSARADDWPQFRGPGGSGVSAETNLPTRWAPDENLRWKADLPGKGVSCPVVVGDRVYVTCCSGANQTRLHVLAFDPKTGKQLWE